jgi:hypothetical protein
MLALAAVVCLGAPLTPRAVRSEVSATLADRVVAQARHPAGGVRHQMGSSILTVMAEEKEARGKLPANATHLMTLVLGFFGTAIWWSGLSTRAHPGFLLPSFPRSSFLSVVCFLQRRDVATLSGVFRL